MHPGADAALDALRATLHGFHDRQAAMERKIRAFRERENNASVKLENSLAEASELADQMATKLEPRRLDDVKLTRSRDQCLVEASASAAMAESAADEHSMSAWFNTTAARATTRLDRLLPLGSALAQP